MPHVSSGGASVYVALERFHGVIRDLGLRAEVSLSGGTGPTLGATVAYIACRGSDDAKAVGNELVGFELAGTPVLIEIVEAMPSALVADLFADGSSEMRRRAPSVRIQEGSTPRLAQDQALIDSMVASHLDELRALSPRFGDVTILFRRARTLGLSAALIKQSHRYVVPLFVRDCETCDTRFVSLGRQSGLCRPCSRQ